MKSLTIFGTVGILLIMFISYISVEKEQKKEHAINISETELNERREIVWDLEKMVEMQKDAIFAKDKIISKQDNHASYYARKIDERNKQNEQQKAELKKELEKAKSNLSQVEAELKEARAKVRTSENRNKKDETTEENEKSDESDVKEAILPIEEPNEEPVIEEPTPAKDDKKEKPPKEEPKPEPEPEPEPRLEPEPEPEPPVVEEPVEEPITIPPPEPEPEPSDTGMTMEATAYVAFCDTGCTGFTATGYDVRNTIYYQGLRIIAVDPNVIPLKTLVNVELKNGSKFKAIALDTGGHIKGNRADLLVANIDEAWTFGRQDIKVTIINP